MRRIAGWLLPPAAADDVAVAVAENEPQAELMCRLLGSAGVAATYQSVHGVGYWAPWNPVGPREIIVRAAAAARARDIFTDAGHHHHDDPWPPTRRRGRQRRPR